MCLGEYTCSHLLVTQNGVGIKLFHFQQNAAGGSWGLHSANADTNFYDINEDSASKRKDWHLEIGSDIDLPVTDQFSVDAVNHRVTLAADTGAVYALKFPSSAAVQLFEQEYNSRLFENTFGVPYTAKNRDEVTVVVLLCLQIQQTCSRTKVSAHLLCIFAAHIVCTTSCPTPEAGPLYSWSVSGALNACISCRNLAKTAFCLWVGKPQNQGSNGLRIWTQM